MVLLLLVVLLLHPACTEREESRPASPTPVPRSETTSQPKLSWKKILSDSIPYPFQLDEKVKPPLVTVKNASPLKREAFETLLADLAKKLCGSDLPYPEVAFEISGEKETLLSARLGLADSCDFSEGEISRPELLRRFAIEEMETLASVRARALAARREGRNIEAREALEKWITFDPKAALAYALLGNIHRDEKRYFDAIRTYLRLEEMEPSNLFAAHNLGYCYERVGAYDDALSAYGRALSLKPNDPKLTKQLAMVHQKNGQRKLALDLIANVRSAVNDSDLWLIEGNIFRDDKQYAKGAEAYQKGLALAPNDHRFLFNLILTDLDQKKYGDAKIKFGELRTKDPTLAEELSDVSVFKDDTE